jgi:hypothetical protein
LGNRRRGAGGEDAVAVILDANVVMRADGQAAIDAVGAQLSGWHWLSLAGVALVSHAIVNLLPVPPATAGYRASATAAAALTGRRLPQNVSILLACAIC